MEKIYNNIPSRLKERMNLPNAYILLDSDQQDFVDAFDVYVNKDEIRDLIKSLRKSINNIDFEIDYLEDRLNGESK